ncbi:MAG TPA: MraY family glycosyltransferase, partial [Candidatus Limnocylindria bacterium]|nr:MraY family glycosyltransferase [Candidatus Limnocylindria bacterium]
FFLAMAAVTLLPVPGGPSQPLRQLPGILLGGLILVAAGLADDLIDLRPLVKLGAQLLAAVVAWTLGVAIHHLAFPWGGVDVGWLSLPLTVIWIVAVINAINLIDGLDGLAAGVTLIALVAFFVIAPNDAPVTLVLGAAAGATLGFLVYNLHPASIIMGDAGSMLLGFLLAAASVAIASPAAGSASAYVPLVVLALPLGDMAWTVLRRLIGGRSVFTPDAGHVHHRLLRLGLTHRDVVTLLHLVAAVLAGIGIGLNRLG